MRIIGGTHKGKHIPQDNRLTLRPTTDFAKEGLFNILNNRFDFEGFDVLDLFSGTGSISYEFASRGAAGIHSVEMDSRHVAFIKNTAGQMGFKQIRVIRDDAFHFLSICKVQYDIVFADPPFDLPKVTGIPEAVLGKGILKPSGILIVEHSKHNNFSESANFIECRKYGNVYFSIFKRAELTTLIV